VHHVAVDRLDKPHAGVVALPDDVDEAFLDDDFHIDARVTSAEGRQHGRDDEWHGQVTHRQLHATDDLAVLGRDLPQGVDDLLQPRPRALDQSPPRVRRQHAAGRAGQEEETQLLFELLHSLADRRRRHPQLASGRAEAAMARDAQKDLKLRECRRLHRGGPNEETMMNPRRRNHYEAMLNN
jgi:hypothetical protein